MNSGAKEKVMVTVAKMVVTVLVSAILVTWYLSYHPHPLSNADFIFVMVSALLSVWVALLIWRIETSRKDKIVRRFVENFLDTETLQSVVDKKLEEKATIVDRAVQRSILFQKGGMKALGLSDDNDTTEESQALHFETLRRDIESDVKIVKDDFWMLYDLIGSVGICLKKFPIMRKSRSYKNYLPTKSA